MAITELLLLRRPLVKRNRTTHHRPLSARLPTRREQESILQTIVCAEYNAQASALLAWALKCHDRNPKRARTARVTRDLIRFYLMLRGEQSIRILPNMWRLLAMRGNNSCCLSHFHTHSPAIKPAVQSRENQRGGDTDGAAATDSTVTRTHTTEEPKTKMDRSLALDEKLCIERAVTRWQMKIRFPTEIQPNLTCQQVCEQELESLVLAFPHLSSGTLLDRYFTHDEE